MIRKVIIMLLSFGLLQSVCAQSNVSLFEIKLELNQIYDELAQIDHDINSFDAAERYEAKYLAHKNLMESCFNAYNNEIRENRETLYSIYENYQVLYIGIGKKIDAFKQRENIRLETEQVKSKLEKYEMDINDLLHKAKDFCEHKKNDSLEKTKSGGNTVFNQVTALQSSNPVLFDDNETLNSMVKNISKSHDEINALTIKKSNIWDILFKIIMVVGMVLMAGNIVSSKINMMKAMKSAAKTPKPEKQKKNEEEFSI